MEPLSLLVALRMRNTSTRSESLSWLALACSLCFRFMAFLISWAHFFFWSFNAFWASCKPLILCNKSLFPSTEDADDPPALLDSEGGTSGEVGAEDVAGAEPATLASASEVGPPVVSAMA